MELINLDEVKKLSISELNNLKEFCENMIHIYEENKELDDLKRWKDKLDAVNKIIEDKAKSVSN